MGRLRMVMVLTRKDIRLFLSDRRAAALAFAVPILLASIFGLVFDRPGKRMTDTRLPILLVVEDQGPATERAAGDICEHPRLEARRTTRTEAEAALADRRCGVAVVLAAGQKVELLHHPLCSLESQWAEGSVTEVMMKRAAGDFLKPSGIAEVGRPFRIEHGTIPAETGHPFNSYSHAFCGMTLQYLLFWGMESGLLFLRERQRGIWKRLRAVPVPLGSLVLARVLSTAWIALLQVLATFAFGYIVFGVTVTGSWLCFVGLALGISVLSAATGMVVAAVGGTEARARNVCILAILTVSMLGGLWLPAFLLPRWVQDLALALPTTWAMQALDGATWQGLGTASLLPGTAMVWLFALGFLALAMMRLTWLENRRLRGFAT